MACIDCENCYHGEVCTYRRASHDKIVLCEHWQPTADVVEVKRGKWEKRTFIVFDNEIKDGYHCSECNTTWDTDTNFCPNCGADMRGAK
jgi:hypothetical protein